MSRLSRWGRPRLGEGGATVDPVKGPRGQCAGRSPRPNGPPGVPERTSPIVSGSCRPRSAAARGPSDGQPGRCTGAIPHDAALDPGHVGRRPAGRRTNGVAAADRPRGPVGHRPLGGSSATARPTVPRTGMHPLSGGPEVPATLVLADRLRQPCPRSAPLSETSVSVGCGVSSAEPTGREGPEGIPGVDYLLADEHKKA
jgi:hypothetical protein